MFIELIERDEAKELYLYSDKTQKEIAAEVGVSDRTIRQWIKQYRWDEHKYRIEHPPLTLSEGIRLQLTNLQNNILAKYCGTPNIDQVNIMHKLILCLYRLSTMPNYDPVVATAIKADNMESSSSVSKEIEEVDSAKRKTEELENFSSVLPEKTEEILAPLNENEQLTQLPHLSKSGSETEAPTFPVLREGGSDLSETEGSKSGSETEIPGVIASEAKQSHETQSTDTPLCPPSKGEDTALPCQGDVNTPTPEQIEAQKEAEKQKAIRQRENIRRFKDSMRWEHDNQKRNNRW